MIEILGVNEGKEFETACHLRERILDAWPDLGLNQNDLEVIFVGVQLYGQRIEEIDILVVGHLAASRRLDDEIETVSNPWRVDVVSPTPLLVSDVPQPELFGQHPGGRFPNAFVKPLAREPNVI